MLFGFFSSFCRSLLCSNQLSFVLFYFFLSLQLALHAIFKCVCCCCSHHLLLEVELLLHAEMLLEYLLLFYFFLEGNFFANLGLVHCPKAGSFLEVISLPVELILNVLGALLDLDLLTFYFPFCLTFLSALLVPHVFDSFSVFLRSLPTFLSFVDFIFFFNLIDFSNML